jgi:hypothetical protein
VSAEFDDYRQRYQWVKRGIEYLVKGSKFNKRRTEMPYELGWFFGNKMGVADEKVQYRALYRDDENFHRELFDRAGLDLSQPDGLGPDRKPDNWLSGRLFFRKAYDMVEAGSRPARSTMMFYRMGPQWLMKYAEGLQAEGVLDEAARYAWRSAGRDWSEFGQRQIVTTFGDTIFLKELDLANQEYLKLKSVFQKFAGNAYDEMLAEKRKTLSPEELAAFEKDQVDRTFEEILMASKVQAVLDISPDSVAKAVDDDKRVEALQMAKRLELAKDKISHIEIYRNQINYAYWEARCEAEQDDNAILARTSMYDADQLLEKGELDAALEKYEVAWQAWSNLFNSYPAMMIDEAADDVTKSIERYRRLLEGDLPADFALADFLTFREIYQDERADYGLLDAISSWRKYYSNRNFLEEMIRKSNAGVAPTDAPENDSSSPSDEVPPGVTVEPPESGTPPSPQGRQRTLNVEPPASGKAPAPQR